MYVFGVCACVCFAWFPVSLEYMECLVCSHIMELLIYFGFYLPFSTSFLNCVFKNMRAVGLKMPIFCFHLGEYFQWG